jgi:hypothetical protein
MVRDVENPLLRARREIVVCRDKGDPMPDWVRFFSGSCLVW